MRFTHPGVFFAFVKSTRGILATGVLKIDIARVEFLGPERGSEGWSEGGQMASSIDQMDFGI